MGTKSILILQREKIYVKRYTAGNFKIKERE